MTSTTGGDEATPAAPSAGKLLAAAGHELRAPLAAVGSLTDLLITRWDRLGEGQRLEILRQVRAESERAGRLVADLLAAARLDGGRMPVRRRPVDLAALATGVVERLAAQWPDLDATVVFAPDVPAVPADPDRMVQVLTNLVENACRHGDPRTVSVEGRVNARAGRVLVSVADRGPGIAAADRSRVFHRGVAGGGAADPGTGLGLDRPASGGGTRGRDRGRALHRRHRRAVLAADDRRSGDRAAMTSTSAGRQPDCAVRLPGGRVPAP